LTAYTEAKELQWLTNFMSTVAQLDIFVFYGNQIFISVLIGTYPEAAQSTPQPQNLFLKDKFRYYTFVSFLVFQMVLPQLFLT
jgi:hypothetical protein